MGKHVLLVENDPTLQKLISRYLLAAGYVVATALDGLDAIAKLRAALPELIVSDLNMPRMDGFEFLQVMRARFPHIPIMLIGDDASDALPAEFTGDAYFQKNRYGFHLLPEALSELTRKVHPRPAAPALGEEPVRARPDANGQYTVDCQDCLREFSIPRTVRIEGAEEWTRCFHCGKMMQFRVAEHFKNT